MKPTEIRELSEEELENKESELKDQLFKLKFQHALGQLENTMKLKTIKQDLARIKTIRKETELENQKERKES
jgi:large subunit ribosomal protein L29